MAPSDYGMVNENRCMICGVEFVQAYQGTATHLVLSDNLGAPVLKVGRLD